MFSLSCRLSFHFVDCFFCCIEAFYFILVHLLIFAFVACVFGMCCAYSLSCVRLFATPWSVAHQSPLSMGILPKRILEWVAMPSSRRLAQPRDWTQVSFIAGGFFTDWAMREAQVYWSGCLSLLQGIFPTQESNQGLLHFRCILYQLSYQGSSLKVTAQINLKGLSLYIFIIYFMISDVTFIYNPFWVHFCEW